MLRLEFRSRSKVNASSCGSIAVATSVLALLLASPAAAVPGLTVVSDAASGDGSASFTRSCASEQRVVSGWGAQSGFADQSLPNVGVDRIVPSADLTSLTVGATETEGGQDAGWILQSTLWCADPLPGAERVAQSSASDSSGLKDAVATCPGSKRVVGIGGEITGGSGQVVLDDVWPNFPLTQAVVRAVEDQNGFSGSWSATAYAICADPVPGLERVKNTTSLDSLDKELGITSVGCPPEKTSIAIGSTINAGLGQVNRGTVNFGGTPAGPADFDISMSAAEDSDGFAGPWSLTEMLICATPEDIGTS